MSDLHPTTAAEIEMHAARSVPVLHAADAVASDFESGRRIQYLAQALRREFETLQPARAHLMASMYVEVMTS